MDIYIYIYIYISVTLETESGIVETLRWLKRQNGKGKEPA